MDKLYYTVGEVAGMLGESTSAVRFWANSFPKLIKPRRNAKGNRMFTASDVEAFRQIHFLIKENGMTLDGAARKLAGEKSDIDDRVKVLDSLKKMKAQLEEIKKSL